ncbi:MAG: PAS domain-containing protein [Nitrospiraceae bacterium]|nr:MAG: PAS domain-containing protein [Nitrospiraceae bacterium]
MELLALLSSRDDVVVPNVKGALKQYTVYPLKTVEELEDLYSNIPLNLLLIDTSSHRLSSVENFLNRLDQDRVVLITPEKLDRYTKDNLPKSVFDSINAEAIRTELPLIVERALERHRFKNELRLLKQSRDVMPPMQMNVINRPEVEVFTNRYDSVPSGRYIHEKVIVNFAKMLTASFDMKKLFNHFIDSVMEIARVSRMSIMLREREIFRIKAQYGLDPYLAENIHLTKDSSLAVWLAKTGRIMNRPVNFFDSESVNVKNEMEILQCVVSFPMIHKGKLIGIFNIDSKVTEESFYREELEIIFVLCNYLAAAVKDIDLYNHMWYQKEFTNNIISSMSSGLIAIDRNEKITVFNQQASEILDLRSSDVIGSDLRALPSPLGDILYETMETGNSYRRHEVVIHPNKLPLGINSYRLLDEEQKPAGAGIIFTDLSDSKKLEDQNRTAEKLKAVNDLMSKIAHEIRNPLTSIQTYIQLLNEKRTDDDLQNFYTATVSHSISRLDNLIDKLITFSSTQNYNFSKENISDIIIEAVAYISRNLPATHKISQTPIDKLFFVNADKKQIVKAMYYVIQNIVDRTSDGALITVGAKAFIRDIFAVEISISYEGEKSGPQEIAKPLLDIDNLGTELNIPISQKIIEGHNGTLTITSDNGVQSFMIKLPVLDRRGSTISYQGGHFAEP